MTELGELSQQVHFAFARRRKREEVFVKLALGALTAFFVAGSAHAQSSAADWIRRPTEAEVRAVYPKEAAAKNVGLVVILTCVVETGGALKNCAATPKGQDDYGFWSAALQLQPLMLMKPAMKDGVPIESTVRIPVTFHPLRGVVSEPSRPLMMTNPEWARRPSADDIATYYPERALRMEMNGSATLSCTVTSKGTLVNCGVVTETPSDYGFGDSAMRLSKLFRAKPVTAEGRPMETGVVRIPINFRVPEQQQQITSPLASGVAAALGTTLGQILATAIR